MTKVFIILFFVSFFQQNALIEEGIASYYSNKFEGRKTSSGEPYRKNLFTAAHKSLKLGTVVRVRNLKNDSTVIVKINDRMSKKSRFVIDLSLAAAKQLNFVKNGTCKVSIEEIEN